MTSDEFLPDTSPADSPHHGSSGESAAHERWFRTLVANSSDLIAVLDDHARVLYANPAAEHILGFAPDEHVGRSSFQRIHSDYRGAIRTIFRESRAVSPGSTLRFRSDTRRHRAIGGVLRQL